MENNNSNGNRSPDSDRFANIRAAEERKLLARNNGHPSKKIIMEQMTNIPIPEDENEDADKNSGRDSGGTASTPVDADNTDSVLLKSNNEKKQNHPRRALEAIYLRYDVSKKSRVPFLFLSITSIILFLIVLAFIIFWPYIPSYMRNEVCTDPECFDASKQIISWMDLKQDSQICENPYKFACGNFVNRYKEHELYLNNRGEWSNSAHLEYEDLTQVNAFISKLPSLLSRSSIQPMIKKIYTNCMNIRSEDRTAENLQVLKTILETARGWNILEQSSNHQWSLLENLPIVQVNFGVHPFFKVSIEDGNITLSEGELGLPDEQLYYYHREHPIIVAYKELIRDVHLSLKASTNSDADTFVDNLFGFERRIVAAMKQARQKGSVSKIHRLYDVKTRAHSLPIDTTIQNMFSNYRVDDDTPVKVKDLELIHQISVVATSTEPKILNDFVMWTLVRKFLPLMSHKIRSSLENFQRKLYGNQYHNNPWYFCTMLTHEWMRFGIEALRQNPELIVVDSSKLKRDELDEQLSYEEKLGKDQTNYNDDLIRMIFHHLRDTFRFALTGASWIDSKFSEFVNYRLSNIRLQLGIPQSVLRNHNYVQQYYRDFILNEINFMRNVEQHWNIEKKILGSLLKGNMTEENRIVYEMFSSTRNGDNRKLKYLKDLNMVIVDREILREPYFHYKYPLPVNFARIGTDLAAILLEASFEIGEEYKEILFNNNQYNVESEDDILFKNTLEGEALKCINQLYSIDNVTFSTPPSIRRNLFSSITSTNIAHRALVSLIEKIDSEPASFDMTFIKELNINKRQNGLMKYGNEEIFSLTYLQKHCAIISDEYKNVKVFAEGRLPEKKVFEIVWKNIPVISESFECSAAKLCSNIL